jgi:hypothetical protein
MIVKIILIALFTLSLGMNIEAHGKERKPTNAYSAIVSYIIIMVLLYLCGIFKY